MYEVSVSGYKVTKSTWGEIYATAKPKKIEISVSYEKGKQLKPYSAVLDQEGVRQVVFRLAQSGAEYVSIRATIDEPTGAHWHVYYKLRKEVQYE